MNATSDSSMSSIYYQTMDQQTLDHDHQQNLKEAVVLLHGKLSIPALISHNEEQLNKIFNPILTNYKIKRNNLVIPCLEETINLYNIIKVLKKKRKKRQLFINGNSGIKKVQNIQKHKKLVLNLEKVKIPLKNVKINVSRVDVTDSSYSSIPNVPVSNDHYHPNNYAESRPVDVLPVSVVLRDIFQATFSTIPNNVPDRIQPRIIIQPLPSSLVNDAVDEFSYQRSIQSLFQKFMRRIRKFEKNEEKERSLFRSL